MPDNWPFTRGYTGHEHMYAFNLINMNGRIFDPMLGMFLCPDNYVQMPDFTQNFNPYSYGLNNPLMFTDPSGEFFWAPLLMFIGGSGLMSAAFFGYDGNSWDWGKAAKGFAAGVIMSGTMVASFCIPGIPQGLTSMGVTGFFPVGLATGGAAFANTALNTASTNWIMTSEFKPNWNASAIAGGLAFVGGGIHGYQNAKNAGLNPWTGDFTKETKAKLAFNGKYDWNEKIAARDAKKFIETVHLDLSKEAGYPTYSIKDLEGARGSTPTPNPNKLLNNPTGLKSNITLDPSVLKRAKRLYMTSFHELSHAKDIFGGQMYTDMKWFMNTHKINARCNMLFNNLCVF